MKKDNDKNTSEQDKYYMRRVLTLARRAWGRTSPNPMVGCVIVRENQIIAEGYHQQAGKPHAEAKALNGAGREAETATLYVNLEPCSTYGRTPPCVDQIIEAGIKRVVIGCLDPFPGHQGRALEKLREHGIQVNCGILKKRAEDLNEAFLCWAKYKRPFVLLKMAMTLDGKIATANGQSKWITSPRARAKVQKMRQWCDAIMVGGETVKQDNPELRVRTPKNWPQQPHKLVWSRRRDFDANLRMNQESKNPVEFINPVSPPEWKHYLTKLAQNNITALLVEGGGELAAICLNAGIVDKVAFFVAPKILGGRNSRPVVGGENPHSLSDAYQLRDTKIQKAGDDLLITGYLSDVYRSY